MKAMRASSVLSIALASKWDLPSIERGILNELSVEEQELPLTGGRGHGIMVSYQAMKNDRESYQHAKVGSAELSYQGRWLHAWLEGFVGQSMFAKVDGSTSARFLAARALVAPRLRPGIPRRVLPFLGASYFDPPSTDEDSANTEVVLGAKLEFSKFWRLQFVVSRIFAEGISLSCDIKHCIAHPIGCKV